MGHEVGRARQPWQPAPVHGPSWSQQIFSVIRDYNFVGELKGNVTGEILTYLFLEMLGENALYRLYKKYDKLYLRSVFCVYLIRFSA